MTEIKLDQTIPIPQSAAGRKSKYPFADMKLGDSFFAPVKTTALHSSAISYNKRHSLKMKFTTRPEINNGVHDGVFN